MELSHWYNPDIAMSAEQRTPIVLQAQ